MSLLQGMRREWVDIHKGEEIGRKEGEEEVIGDVLRNFSFDCR